MLGSKREDALYYDKAGQLSENGGEESRRVEMSRFCLSWRLGGQGSCRWWLLLMRIRRLKEQRDMKKVERARKQAPSG